MASHHPVSTPAAPLSEIEALFDSMDENKSGHISREEITKVLASHNLPITTSHLDKLLESTETQHGMSRSDFVEVYRKREEELRHAYHHFDADKNGKVSALEVREALREIGMLASDGEIREFVNRVDHDSDGHVTFSEFVRFLRFLPESNPRAIFEKFRRVSFMEDAQSELTLPRDFGPQRQSMWVLLGSGGIAGSISRTATAPLERMRTIMQAHQRSMKASAVFRDISKEGYRGYFCGNATNVLKVAPETATKYFLFDVFKSHIAKDKSNPTMLERVAAGGSAGALAQVLVYPLETVKTRLSLAAPGTYPSVWSVMAGLAKSQGIAGLYRGVIPSALAIFPYAGVDLATSTRLQEHVAKFCEKRSMEPNVATLMGCGMVSSTTGMFVAYPMILVRTRLQCKEVDGLNLPKYNGAIDCVRKTVASQGIRGLYRGLAINLFKVVPSTSISCAAFNTIRKGWGEDDD